MRTNNKLNPHMSMSLGMEPVSHWWEVSALTLRIPFISVVTLDGICRCKRLIEANSSNLMYGCISSSVHLGCTLNSFINLLRNANIFRK